MTRNRSLKTATLGTIATLVVSCTQALKLAPDDSKTVLATQAISAPNPGLPGTLHVKTMYYGSGTDKRRPEFKDSVTLKTPSVDGSAFVSITGDAAKAHDKDWGFTLKKMPLNGRVWYPDGDGPFPLVLVVHGNHTPDDYSDPGYRYLGEQLASHGFILVSVDENFINGLSGENDGRGWLLLKHLELWKKWNDSTGSPFHGKVDMHQIALMGHSRGGEAIAHAATFNRLKYYPDDAKVKLDFNFDIKALVAIAPVDGQYKPASVFEPLENVNYLVIHGSHDGDVSSFNGLRQFQRLRFTDGQPWFKSAWYVYRANHGQWNQVWGNKDNGPRSGRSLDLRGLISADDQRQFGRVVITAFLESTLKGKQEYLPMFRDHRTAGAWLPKTMYITRFQASGFTPVALFDEDVDVTTGTAPGVRIRGDSLGTWKESGLMLRGGNNDAAQHERGHAGLEQHGRRTGHHQAGEAGELHHHPARFTDPSDRGQPGVGPLLLGRAARCEARAAVGSKRQHEEGFDGEEGFNAQAAVDQGETGHLPGRLHDRSDGCRRRFGVGFDSSIRCPAPAAGHSDHAARESGAATIPEQVRGRAPVVRDPDGRSDRSVAVARSDEVEDRAICIRSCHMGHGAGRRHRHLGQPQSGVLRRPRSVTLVSKRGADRPVVIGKPGAYVDVMRVESEPEETTGDLSDIRRSMDAIRAVVRSLRLNTRAIEQKIGISLAQLYVLQQVAERPAESLNDLAERTATHQSSVSVVVRRLVDRGLVSRRSSTVDKRRVQIAVTPAGHAVLKGAPRTIQLRLVTAMDSLSPAERHQLAELLERWLGAAGISYTSPPMMGEEDDETE